MSRVEKSYIPQYIQFDRVPSKPSDSSENEATKGNATDAYIANGRPVEVIIANGNNRPIQNPMYPPLVRSIDSDGESVTTPLIPKLKHDINKTSFWGVFLAFISGVFFTLCSSTVKYLTNVDPMALLVIRSTFQVSVHYFLLLFFEHVVFIKCRIPMQTKPFDAHSHFCFLRPYSVLYALSKHI